MRDASSYRGAARNDARGAERLGAPPGPSRIREARKLNRSRKLPFARDYEHAKLIAKAKENTPCES